MSQPLPPVGDRRIGGAPPFPATRLLAEEVSQVDAAVLVLAATLLVRGLKVVLVRGVQQAAVEDHHAIGLVRDKSARGAHAHAIGVALVDVADVVVVVTLGSVAAFGFAFAPAAATAFTVGFSHKPQEAIVALVEAVAGGAVVVGKGRSLGGQAVEDAEPTGARREVAP